MKLFTMASLSSSGGLSSARNAADGTTGDAFGSLLKRMSKDDSAGTPTDSSRGQQTAESKGSAGDFAISALAPALDPSGQQAAKMTDFAAVSKAGVIVPTVLSLGQFAAGTTSSAGMIATVASAPTVISNDRPATGPTSSAAVIETDGLGPVVSSNGRAVTETTGSTAVVGLDGLGPVVSSNGRAVTETTGSTAVVGLDGLAPVVSSNGRAVTETTGSTAVVGLDGLAPVVTSNGQPAIGTTGSAGVIATDSLLPTVNANGQSIAKTTVSTDRSPAGAFRSTDLSSGFQAAQTTGASAIPVAGAHVPADLSSGQEAADTTDIGSVSAAGKLEGKPNTVSSPTLLPLQGEPRQANAAVIATEPVRGIEYVADRKTVGSLLTLAARAADPRRIAAAPSAPVSTASGATIVSTGVSETGLNSSVGSSENSSADPGLHATDRVAKKRSAPEGGERSNGEGLSATTSVPQVPTGLAVVTGLPADAAVPNASDVTMIPATVVARAPTEAPTFGKDATTGVALAPDATQASLADLPLAAAIDNPGAPLQSPGNAAPVDLAVVPGTVRVESHLGFFRGAPVARTEPPPGNGSAETETQGVENSAPETGASGSDRFAGVGRTGFVTPAAAPTTSGVRAAGARGADTRPVSPAITVKAPSLSSPAGVSPTSKPASEEPGQVDAGMTGPAPVMPAMSIVLPSSQTAAPVTIQVADTVAFLAAAVPDENQLVTQVAPARTMALQLSPAGLGTLRVHLHVVGRSLDVRLEASESSTASLIDRNRDALSSALRGKDYQLQSLSVTTHDATMPGGTHAESGTDAGSADSGSSGPSRDGGSFGGRSGDQGSRDTSDRAAQPSRGPTDELDLERGGSSLFV